MGGRTETPVRTLYLSHPAYLQHLTPLGHPERPDRIKVVEQVLEREEFQDLIREMAPLATADQIARAHPRAFVEHISRASPAEGILRLDSDTAMSPGSLEAAFRASGAAIAAVDEVMTGKVDNAFSAHRPPGHHAEHMTAMGFCLFNHAAVAARHAQAVHGAERVAIVDFDVHHGNGTQDIFWADPTVFYASTHQMPLYPGTGAVNETGETGNICNAPLSAGDDGSVFREAFDVRVLPALHDFSPDLVIISAGFDAHFRDPLAEINLVEADFAWVTKRLMDVADRHCGGRVVSLLEGGYDLVGLSRSVAAHVGALMGH
jgi:acetoin utilization deacetylase AcuC-like enzyme